MHPIYGLYTILSIESKYVTVKFSNTNSVYTFSSASVYKNHVKDYKAKTFLGVGCLDRMTKKNTFTETERLAMETWQRMLYRCYGRVRNRETYDNCSVHEVWHSFENFLSWFEDQVSYGYYEKGYQLDKDLLVLGNRVYSPETCVFLPFRLNSLLQVKKLSKNNYLPGVNFDKSRGLFKSEVNFNGTRHYGPRCKTELEAYSFYKELKEFLVRDDAKNWEGKIHPSAITKLSEYSLDWVLEQSSY